MNGFSASYNIPCLGSYYMLFSRKISPSSFPSNCLCMNRNEKTMAELLTWLKKLFCLFI